MVVEIAAESIYVCNALATALAGETTTRGAAPNAVANVRVARLPVAAHPVPVVTVISPAVSVPATLTVGVVQAAAPAAMVGTVPVVMI